MKEIANNTVVSLTYKLSIDDQFVEEATKEAPLMYIAGIGAMIPGFENQLSGKAVGDQFKIRVTPNQGYGDYDEQAVVSLPINTFEIDGVVDRELIKVGNKVPMKDEEDHSLEGIILEVSDDIVKIDFNDILAGKTLDFEGEILNVIPATSDELDNQIIH
jgi:FKBP-type peptidyl-prolyl cis-trans isomerase SlyD